MLTDKGRADTGQMAYLKTYCLNRGGIFKNGERKINTY